MKGMTSTKTRNYGPIIFFAVIFILGVSLMSTLAYGMANFETGQSISEHMIDSLPYRTMLSMIVSLQVIIWMICAYSKRDMEPETVTAAFVCLTMVLLGWIGLSIFLENTAHYVFAAIAVSNIVFSILIFSRLTWQQIPRYILFVSLVPFLACIGSMLLLFGTPKFYIPEYLAFIFYSAFFTLFFLAHPYYDWATYPDIDIYTVVEDSTAHA